MSEIPPEDYMPVEEVAALLGITVRQASRYAQRVRTRRVGKRILFHRADIEAVAVEKRQELEARGEARDYQPPPKKAELLPPSELLDYLRERDAQFTQTILQAQQQLLQAAHRIGMLEEENRRLKEELSKHMLPWWRKLFTSPKPPEEPPGHIQTPPSDEK